MSARDPDTVVWNDEFTHVLWRAQNAVHRAVQAALDELGVTATQLGLAVHLEELGALSAADLSRGFHLTPQSVGTALTRLEKIGWADREPHPVHGRVVLYQLSTKGLAGVKRGRAIMASVNEQVTSVLGRSELDGLIAGLRKVTAEIDGPAGTVQPLWPLRET
ncbi:MarR family winged helix-turn-helix transcriptional regulator [Actinophytocola sp.]|uniref:MarR family winged helix-turn-helix transcriptional regulator n=1 Tax=Actinophytocola sp. TaxID=1872138 RepID=UPI002ECFDEEF